MLKDKCFPLPDFESMSMLPDERPSLLFVDDRTKRIHYAINLLMRKYDVIIAANVPEALRLMSKYDFDFISLDHDLNGHDFQSPDTPTCGMEIVRYLEQTGWPSDKPKPTFVVHSSNAFAAHALDVALQELGFRTHQSRIYYDQSHMEYDEDGIPE